LQDSSDASSENSPDEEDPEPTATGQTEKLELQNKPATRSTKLGKLVPVFSKVANPREVARIARAEEQALR
jgi:hypothetical protein